MYNKYNEGTYYKIVKLKTGETILCTMNSDVRSIASETYLQLNSPVQVVPYMEQRKENIVVEESFIFRPWLGLSDSEAFTITCDIVLTIGNVKKEVQKQYTEYVEHSAKSRKKIVQQVECEEAVDEFLRDLNNGTYRLIDDDIV
jgi:hypothetical protein